MIDDLLMSLFVASFLFRLLMLCGFFYWAWKATREADAERWGKANHQMAWAIVCLVLILVMP